MTSDAAATPWPQPVDRLVVCAPLRVEARAVRRGLRDGVRRRIDGDPPPGEPVPGGVQVVHTGYGTARATQRAGELRHRGFGALAVAGTGAGLAPGLRPGDLVVGARVAAVTPDADGASGSDALRCPSAPVLAGELRRAGLSARVGRIATVDHLVGPAERRRLAAAGWDVADMESAVLAAAAAGHPVAVVRAVSDTGRLLRPGTVTGGLAALRSLRAAAAVLDRWAAACRPRRVLLAAPRSFCAGVERAIDIVEQALRRWGPPVYVRKQIVHNSRVVAELSGRGAVFVDELDEVPDGARVVFSAHGVSPAVRQDAARRGLSVVDATCPLVAKVHAEARRFAADGYLVALIGHAGHEEVEGTLGEAAGAAVLVQTPDDVAALRPRDDRKVAYLMQTTLAADEASQIVDALRDRFPDVRGPGSDDICYATTNRQRAVRAIAGQCDLLLVAGSGNSSNSLRLVETAERAGTRAYLVDGAEDIQLGWLTGVSTIGLTAGASAPPAVVAEIIDALGGLGPVETDERVVTTESRRFSLPKEVRQSWE